MGWFIAQSLAFIIIAAMIGLAIGIWTGWVVWGRRARGKHTAEQAEAAARSASASSAATATSDDEASADAGTGAAGTEPSEKEKAEAVPALATAGAAATAATAAENDGAKDDTEPATGTDAVLPAADEAADGDSGAGADADDDAGGTETADSKQDATEEHGTEDEVAAAESDVVAEAEAVAREAAEAAAAQAAARVEAAAEAGADAEAAVQPEAAPDAAPEADQAPDDLQRLEGVGPKIAAALKAAGYTTYAKIAGATEAELREAVAGQGIKFAPAAASWADQAQYLVDNDAKGLEEYQDYLVGGQERRAKFNENVDYTDVDEIEGAAAKAAALAEDETAAAAVVVPEPEPTPEPEPEPQDLQRIEGIGPKIESTLHAAGFATYAKIAAASKDELRAALATGGITFAPAAASWADQAQYLADGDETGLQEYQDYLVGGQDRAAKFRKDVDYTDVDEVEGTAAKAAALAEDEAKAEAAESTEDDEPTQSEVKA